MTHILRLIKLLNSEFRILNSEYRIPNYEFRIPNSEFRIPNSEFRISKKVVDGNFVFGGSVYGVEQGSKIRIIQTIV